MAHHKRLSVSDVVGFRQVSEGSSAGCILSGGGSICAIALIPLVAHIRRRLTQGRGVPWGEKSLSRFPGDRAALSCLHQEGGGSCKGSLLLLSFRFPSSPRAMRLLAMAEGGAAPPGPVRTPVPPRAATARTLMAVTPTTPIKSTCSNR